MMRSGWLVVFLGALSASGNFLPVDERCVAAIYSAFNYITFAGVPAAGMWATRCQNPLQVTSIYASSEVYCAEEERISGLQALKSQCEEFGHCQLLPREAVAGNLTEDVIRDMRRVEYMEVPRGEAVDTPVLLSADYFGRMFKTIDSWNFEVCSHHAFGYAGYAYWGGLLLLGILCRLTKWRFQYRRTERDPEIESHNLISDLNWHAPPGLSGLTHWVKTHLLISTPLGKGQEVLACTFSNRAEALAVAGFWVMSFVLSFIGYRTFEGNLYWPNQVDQVLRFSADRTGIMSFANLPLLWLFGGRNNILIWVTNWSFATFNIFHRHVARIATLQAVAHTLIYIVIYARTGKWWKFLTEEYILWGILGTVVMVLLLVGSLDRIRIESYEFFLLLHIFLSVLTLIGCFYHTIVFEGNEYWQYLWPSVAVWIIDRFLRVVRLVYCNIHVKISSPSQVSTSSSWMTYDEVADVIRLEVFMEESRVRLNPGDYFFLYQPFRWTGWESHPFTVGAWMQDIGKLSLNSTNRRRESALDASHLPLLADSGIEYTEQNAPDEEFKARPEKTGLGMTFWIRPYDGWTQQLRQQCLKSKSQPVNTTILLEGPYGHEVPVWQYDTMLMIVGGTGIASAIPYLHDHIRRSADDSTEPQTHVQDIELVWTTKQASFVDDVAQRELRHVLTRPDFKASFYSTSDLSRTSIDQDAPGYKVTPGRPDLKSLIMDRACEASSSRTSLVIFVCGPVGMACEARKATQLAMQRGYRGIKYTEDSFTW